MNRLSWISLKLVRWTGWLLLPFVLAFLVTGYAMSGIGHLSSEDRLRLAPAPVTMLKCR